MARTLAVVASNREALGLDQLTGAGLARTHDALSAVMRNDEAELQRMYPAEWRDDAQPTDAQPLAGSIAKLPVQEAPCRAWTRLYIDAAAWPERLDADTGMLLLASSHPADDHVAGLSARALACPSTLAADAFAKSIRLVAWLSTVSGNTLPEFTPR